MDRRDALRVLMATSLAAECGICQHQGAVQHRASIASYKPRVFTDGEYQLLDLLCEAILPADAESGGAHDAGVAFYLDTVVFHSGQAVQELWRRGLAEIDRVTHERFRRRFADLDDATRSQMLSELLVNERSPATSLEQFVVRLKAATIDGYCLSEVGLKYFGYKGNTALTEFPGCTHPEHKAKL